MACGGAAEDPQASPEASQDDAELRALSPAARMARLAALLRKPNAVKMPPLGVAQAANELGSHVDLLPASSQPLNELLRERVATGSPDLGPLTEYFTLSNPGSPNIVQALVPGTDAELEGNDIHAKIEFGHDDPQIQKYLLEDLLDHRQKTEAKALLSGLHADYARMTIYDIGAEIIAVDVIVIRPDAPGSKTLVLQVSYVGA